MRPAFAGHAYAWIFNWGRDAQEAGFGDEVGMEVASRLRIKKG